MSIILIAGCTIENKNEITTQLVENSLDQQYSESMKDPAFALNIDTVKSEFGEKFLELRAIINRHDPIGLLDIEAPKDVYESEVKTIIIQLHRDMHDQEVHDLVYKEFQRWFKDVSTVGKKESYLELAADISQWNKTGFYINEHGKVHIDSIYIDENEIRGDFNVNY